VLRVAVLTVVVAGALSACASSTPQAAPSTASHSPGVPSEALVCGTARNGSEPCAAWAGPREIFVVAWTGSSCPYVVSGVTVSDKQELRVELVNDYIGGNQSCTADHEPMTSRVPLPVGVSEDQSIVVVIQDERVVLPPRAG
jgi:hypothetical protein